MDYFRLIAVLEAHIAKDKDATNGSKGLSLKRLLVWTQDSLQRLRLMSVLVECCQGKVASIGITSKARRYSGSKPDISYSFLS